MQKGNFSKWTRHTKVQNAIAWFKSHNGPIKTIDHDQFIILWRQEYQNCCFSRPLKVAYLETLLDILVRHRGKLHVTDKSNLVQGDKRYMHRDTGIRTEISS